MHFSEIKGSKFFELPYPCIKATTCCSKSITKYRPTPSWNLALSHTFLSSLPQLKSIKKHLSNRSNIKKFFMKAL